MRTTPTEAQRDSNRVRKEGLKLYVLESSAHHEACAGLIKSENSLPFAEGLKTPLASVFSPEGHTKTWFA